MKLASQKEMLQDLRESLKHLNGGPTPEEVEVQGAIDNINKGLADYEAKLIALNMKIDELRGARYVGLESDEDRAIKAMAEGRDPSKALRELETLQQDREALVNLIETAKRGLTQYHHKRTRASQEKIHAAFGAVLGEVKTKYRLDLERVLQEVEKIYFHGWNQALKEALQEINVGTGAIGLVRTSREEAFLIPQPNHSKLPYFTNHLIKVLAPVFQLEPKVITKKED